MIPTASQVSDAVLVSWVSVNHHAAPIVTALADPKRPRVTKLYLCWRDASRPDGDREREALRVTVQELKKKLAHTCPEIVELAWKTNSSPTDHAAIRSFVSPILQRIREENPHARIVILLSPGTPAMHAVWLVLGTTGFISEPVELIQTADDRGRAAGQSPVQAVDFRVDSWLQRFRSSRPGEADGDDLGHLWDPVRAKSPARREALAKLKRWAPLRAPVLLVGERGTGKTTLANVLRSMSPFQNARNATWPTVVCGQFRANPQLARSELFGHAKGAFTGATAPREGLLEQADNDTIFFDEIADIDRDTQRLLMAAMEGRGFVRLGETRARQSSFRLVCATNRSQADLRTELLDPDFFDRIAVFVLAVPSLRQCQEDLPDAWREVLTQTRSRAGVSPERWKIFRDHPKLLAAISCHPLPGNYRDLQRAAFYLLASLNAGRSEKEVLADAVDALGDVGSPGHGVPDFAHLADVLPLQSVRHQVQAYERAWFDAALKKAAGNKSVAARLLGMDRKTFADRLGKLRGGNK